MNWYVLKYGNKFIQKRGDVFLKVKSKDDASLFTYKEAKEMQTMIPMLEVRKFGRYQIEIEKFKEE